MSTRAPRSMYRKKKQKKAHNISSGTLLPLMDNMRNVGKGIKMDCQQDRKVPASVFTEKWKSVHLGQG